MTISLQFKNVKRIKVKDVYTDMPMNKDIVTISITKEMDFLINKTYGKIKLSHNDKDSNSPRNYKKCLSYMHIIT